jgi:hypothetical protein
MGVEWIDGRKVDAAHGLAPDLAAELARQFLSATCSRSSSRRVPRRPAPGERPAGLLGRIDEDTRSGLSLLMLAIAQNRGDDVADLIISLSLTGVDADQPGFVHYPDLRVMPTWVSEHVARGVMRRSGRHNPGRSRPHALG